MGLSDFWRAHPWTFAMREDEITTVAGTDTYTLDSDFESAITIREKQTLSGNRLTFVPREEFDWLVPAGEAHTSTTPSIYTVYWDDAVQANKLKLFPVPDAVMTLYLLQRCTPPSSTEAVPEVFLGGLTAVIWKYLWPTGPNKRQAIIDAQMEIQDCIKRDVKNSSDKNFIILDAAEDPRQRGYLWEKNTPWRR